MCSRFASSQAWSRHCGRPTLRLRALAGFCYRRIKWYNRPVSFARTANNNAEALWTSHIALTVCLGPGSQFPHTALGARHRERVGRRTDVRMFLHMLAGNVARHPPPTPGAHSHGAPRTFRRDVLKFKREGDVRRATTQPTIHQHTSSQMSFRTFLLHMRFDFRHEHF